MSACYIKTLSKFAGQAPLLSFDIMTVDAEDTPQNNAAILCNRNDLSVVWTESYSENRARVTNRCADQLPSVVVPDPKNTSTPPCCY